jgi:hypothetical protein
VGGGGEVYGSIFITFTPSGSLPGWQLDQDWFAGKYLPHLEGGNDRRGGDCVVVVRTFLVRYVYK